MKRPFDPLAAAKPAREIAYPFVLDRLAKLALSTRPMFGCTAVYDGDEVLFILREKGDDSDGVWVAFDEAREGEALAALPNLVKIGLLPNVRCWRMLAASSDTFEEDVLAACRLAQRADRPIGKIPVRAKAKTASSRKASAKKAVEKAPRKATASKKTPTSPKKATREKTPSRGSR